MDTPMKYEFGNTLPIPLTEEAQKERERFLSEVQKQAGRARKISLTVLVWGPSENTDNAVAVKRMNIRDRLRKIGHNALFSEEISDKDFFKGLSEKGKEFVEVVSAHVVIVLLESSPGALAEAHDFCNHPDLAEKFYVMIPQQYKEGYSGQGAIKDLDDGFGGVYWYAEGEIESCRVLEKAVDRVEARRNIIYRHSSSGDSI